MEGVYNRLSLTRQGMRGGIRAWRHIELKAQIAHVDRLHLAGGIVVEVVGNARYLCLNG